MGNGDAGMEDVWHWDNGPGIAFKGPTGNSGGLVEPCTYCLACSVSLAAKLVMNYMYCFEVSS